MIRKDDYSVQFITFSFLALAVESKLRNLIGLSVRVLVLSYHTTGTVLFVLFYTQLYFRVRTSNVYGVKCTKYRSSIAETHKRNFGPKCMTPHAKNEMWGRDNEEEQI